MSQTVTVCSRYYEVGVEIYASVDYVSHMMLLCLCKHELYSNAPWSWQGLSMGLIYMRKNAYRWRLFCANMSGWS